MNLMAGRNGMEQEAVHSELNGCITLGVFLPLESPNPLIIFGI
jgi:hypothetical protein